VITDAHVLQTFFTQFGYGEVPGKTTLGPTLAGAGLEEHPDMLGPYLFPQLQILYTTWVWGIAYQETTLRTKIGGVRAWGTAEQPIKYINK